MHRYLRAFWQHSVDFARENAWVFAAFPASLVAIAVSHRGDLLEIAIVFTLHFAADILIMMMMREYGLGNRKAGTLLQVSSKGIFLALTLHSGLAHGAWQYLAAELLFLLAALKNYQLDLNGRDLRWINSGTGVAIAAAVMGLVYYPAGLLQSPAQLIQTIGTFTFALALVNARSEVKRHYLGVTGLGFMVLGSGLECFRTFEAGAVAGLALSYFLLPTTVLLFYLRQWPRQAWPRPRMVEGMPPYPVGEFIEESQTVGAGSGN
jgi:hypothetical protein